jgi:hypothetical protein
MHRTGQHEVSWHSRRTMYGVPSIVMIATSKNRNFMRRIGREDLLSSFDSEALIDKFLCKPEPIQAAVWKILNRGLLKPCIDCAAPCAQSFAEIVLS